MNSLLQFLRTNDRRVDFTNDVTTSKEVKDITDLVNKVRNAAVHDTTSKDSFLDGNNWFVFNVVQGLVPSAFNINGQVLGCDYEDDIAYYYGNHRVYLKRHIYRLFSELESALAK
ncbi:MAG TPA: hypothetical protein VLF67_01455 [Candidatus Saccharimonas sp.]|nr:hypothetical protein [Candidatus Saccharimonas sp.]